MWDFGKIEIPLTEPKTTTSLRTIVIHRVKKDVGFGRSNNSHTSGCVGADNRLTDYYFFVICTCTCSRPYYYRNLIVYNITLIITRIWKRDLPDPHNSISSFTQLLLKGLS